MSSNRTSCSIVYCSRDRLTLFFPKKGDTSPVAVIILRFTGSIWGSKVDQPSNIFFVKFVMLESVSISISTNLSSHWPTCGSFPVFGPSLVHDCRGKNCVVLDDEPEFYYNCFYYQDSQNGNSSYLFFVN